MRISMRLRLLSRNIVPCCYQPRSVIGDLVVALEDSKDPAATYRFWLTRVGGSKLYLASAHFLPALGFQVLFSL
jgi:hypothetical protein